MGFVDLLKKASETAGKVEVIARGVQGAIQGGETGAVAAQTSYRPPTVTAIPTAGLAPDQGILFGVGAIVLVLVVILVIRR